MSVGDETILEARNLVKHFPLRRGLLGGGARIIRAVEDVSLSLRAGETLGLVGESGSGKSTTGRMLMRLVEPTSGTLEFAGTDYTKVDNTSLRRVRRDVQIVFQDPYASLNARLTIAQNIAEPLRIHSLIPAEERRDRAVALLQQVGLKANAADKHPAQFSGGQLQRVGIARALASQPKVLILDEPVSSLDVSVRAQILNLLGDLQESLGVAYLIISHDLAAVRHMCDQVAVMHLGAIIETGTKDEVYEQPLHPYTRALLSAIPRPTPASRSADQGIILSGEPPSPANPPSGCTFRERCWKAQDVCAVSRPDLITRDEGKHPVACYFPEAS